MNNVDKFVLCALAFFVGIAFLTINGQLIDCFGVSTSHKYVKVTKKYYIPEKKPKKYFIKFEINNRTKKIEVSKKIYNKTSLGDKVGLSLKQGRFSKKIYVLGLK